MITNIEIKFLLEFKLFLDGFFKQKQTNKQIFCLVLKNIENKREFFFFFLVFIEYW